jgi:hypothetical protein
LGDGLVRFRVEHHGVGGGVGHLGNDVRGASGPVGGERGVGAGDVDRSCLVVAPADGDVEVGCVAGFACQRIDLAPTFAGIPASTATLATAGVSVELNAMSTSTVLNEIPCATVHQLPHGAAASSWLWIVVSPNLRGEVPSSTSPSPVGRLPGVG